jgi:hypothetical protein
VLPARLRIIADTASSVNTPSIWKNALPAAVDVDALLVQEQANLALFQDLQRVQQIRQAATQPIDGPPRRHVEPATDGVLQQSG